MGRTVAIGIQDFETIIEKNYFYVDKTKFIKEWWESGDSVTLITRPRRFGKTLNMSMLEHFFSMKYEGQDKLFEGLAIWEDEEYRKLQGTYPVISLTFANIKESEFQAARQKINEVLSDLYEKNSFLKESGLLGEREQQYFDRVAMDMDDSTASFALHRLADYLSRYYGKKVIILLDEYDTPMQEAYVHGYWEDLVSYLRGLFNSTFKTNPYLERGIMTGITRVSRESMFSDLNNLKVVTTTSSEYADAFGFTEAEVFAAMDEQGLTEKETVKRWYDGFKFGDLTDIYNPWSILNYLDTGKEGTYWANTSSNSLAGKLIREGSPDAKKKFEILLQGGSITAAIDEQIVYNHLEYDEDAVWSLLLASGYLKALSVDNTQMLQNAGEPQFELCLTNMEVQYMFSSMIRVWFRGHASDEYNKFLQAMLLDDIDAMNDYMNDVALTIFSSFDTGMRPSRNAPERFYHGFVLGLLVNLSDRYVLKSNHESGLGRYDIMLEPKEVGNTLSEGITGDAIIIEFKVFNARREKNLEETVENALKQIEEKKYETELLNRGIAKEHIRKYGFAFEGKTVMIGRNS